MRWFLSLALTGAAFGAGAGLAARPASFPDRAPPGHTGGFGEPTCQVCHAGADLDVAGDGLRLEGRPGAYAPGRTYRLTVELKRPGMARSGFQLTARLADGSQAGRLLPRDTTTGLALLPNSAVQYLGHFGARDARDSARWVFFWVAPAAGGDVVFNIAANAANFDASELGDYIYVREYRVPRRP